MKPWLSLIPILLLFSLSCKEKTYIHSVNEITVTPNNAGKNKEKSTEQFINITYANLYQEALSPNDLVDKTELILSIGDKQVAYESVIAKMMVDPNVKLPTKDEMLADVEGFIIETYKRFYVRLPSEAEKTWWENYIESHPNLTPELMYFAFATSNEYNFY